MKHRHLGASPLKISPLCLGTMMFADQTDLGTAREIVAHAREHGVNFIDTADVYSLGKSESMVGELLKGQRDDWIVATKLGNRMSERPNEIGLLAPLGAARVRREPQAPGGRLHRHLLHAPRLQRHAAR